MSDTQLLLHAFRQRQDDPEALDRLLDTLLDTDRLDRAFSRLYPVMADEDFETLRLAAMARAGVVLDEGGGNPRVHVLVAMPVLADERHLPTVDRGFWARLSTFAQATLDHPEVHFTGLTDLLHIQSVTYLKIGAWQALVREQVEGGASMSLELLQAMDAAHAEGYRPVASTQVLAVTQRLALGVFHAPTEAFHGAPLQALFRAGRADKAAWAQVTGPTADYVQMLPPQSLREALRLSLQQHFELAIQIAQRHRDLPSDGPLNWATIQSEGERTTFVPVAGEMLLDPIVIGSPWLNLVGGAEVGQIMAALIRQPAAVEPAVDRPASLPRRRLH